MKASRSKGNGVINFAEKDDIYFVGIYTSNATIQVLRHSLPVGSNGLHFSNIWVLITNGLIR